MELCRAALVRQLLVLSPPQLCLAQRGIHGVLCIFSLLNPCKGSSDFLKRCSFPSLPFQGKGAWLGGSCSADAPGERGDLSPPRRRVPTRASDPPFEPEAAAQSTSQAGREELWKMEGYREASLRDHSLSGRTINSRAGRCLGVGLRSTTFPQAPCAGRAERSTWWMGLGREEARSGTEAELAVFCVLPQPPSSSSSSWQVCPAGHVWPPGSKCETVPTSGEVFSPLVLFWGWKEPGGVAWVPLRALFEAISRDVPSH